MREDLVQALANIQDLAGMDLDVRRLTLESAQRLVDHHPRMWQREALALGTAGQQEGAHAAGLTDAQGADRSEEHTSELQSRPHLVCRLLLEKKKTRHP